jgi:hypothetical protein
MRVGMSLRGLMGRPRVREYLLVITVLMVIGLIEGRNVLWMLFSNTGSGDFSYATLPFTGLEKFHYAPLALLDWLNVPSPVAISLLMMSYQLLGGFFAYVLAKQYYVPGRTGFKGQAILVPLIASIAYTMFPWNNFGDNFPTLILVRAFSPLVVLLLLVSLRKNSLRLAALGGLSLSVLTLADPRSALFLVPISIMLVTIPEIVSRSIEWRRALRVNGAFMVLAMLGLGVQAIYRLPGIIANDAGVRSSSGVVATLNSDSFIPNFIYASPINYLAGMSYEATYRDFFVYATQFGGLVFLVTILSAALLVFLILYSIFFIKEPKERARVTVIVFFVILSIALFSILPWQNLPFIISSLISSETVRDSPILSTLVIMFRKTRFANLVILLSLIPLISICLGHFFSSLTKIKWNFRAVAQPKALCALIVLSLISSSLLIWAVPQINRGNGLQFYGGVTFELTDESMDLSAVVSQINQDPTIDQILVIQPVNEGLPNMYTLKNIEGGTVQYLVHYVGDTIYSPMIQQGDYTFMWEILRGIGIRYVIVDGYAIDSYYSTNCNGRAFSPSYHDILTGLSDSPQFTEVAAQGKITAFRLIDSMSSDQSGLFVLGGLEDFRGAYPYLSSQTDATLLPITLDSYFPVESMEQLPNWPILVGPHKTIEDLQASLAILQSKGTTLQPASWVQKQWSPYNNWSPGYIQDRIGGLWSPLLKEVTNYEWSFSYLPDYGYAFTMGAEDTISYSQNFDSGEYVLLARAMHSPEGGEIDLNVGGRTYDIQTGWENQSSELLWTNLGTIDLSGETRFELTNVEGTNAVNLVMAIPVDEWNAVKDATATFLENRTVIYNLDPNRVEWDGNNGTSTSSFSVLMDGQFNVSSSGEGDQEVVLYQGSPVLLNGTEGTISLTEGQADVVYGDSLETIFEEHYEDTTWINGYEYTSPESIDLGFSGRLDSSEKASGNSSLNLTTSISQADYWRGVISDPITVTPGEQYLFSVQMKWVNMNQPLVYIDGIREDGRSYRLAELAIGTEVSQNWTQFDKIIKIPAGTTSIQVVLNAGGVDDIKEGSATAWFDDLTIQGKVDSSSTLILYEGNPVVDGGLLTTGQDVSSNGYTNTYDFSFSGSGWTMRSVPDSYYSTSLSPRLDGVSITTMPIYFTSTGILITAQGGNSTLSLENRSEVDLNNLGLLTFGIISGIVAIIVLSYFVRWPKKKGVEKP